MDVTRGNFEQLLGTVREAIQAADFVAFDTEFTGLGITDGEQLDLLDTAQERYAKRRCSALQFQPIQVGICAFQWDDEVELFVARPFNFFVFPRTGSKALGLERTFTVQASSLEFLASNNFDFNRWVVHGVPFVSQADASAIRKRIEAMDDSDIVIDERNQPFVDSAIAGVKEWLQNSSSEMLSVSTPTSYHKRLIHQEVKKQFNGFLSTESTRTSVDVRRMTTEEKEKKESRSAIMLVELESMIGFRRVMDILADAKKPIVGHNMFLDLCHVFNRFFKPLPESFADFKSSLLSNFPTIFDTKYVAAAHTDLTSKIPSTLLGEMHTTVTQEPFKHPVIRLAPGYERYDGTGVQLHEAGYDAYITGISFLQMISFVAEKPLAGPINWSDAFVSRCANKINAMRSDYEFFDLAGEDKLPDRSNVFLLTDFPSKWRSSDILARFKDLGSMTIKWINSTSCLLILRDFKMVTLASKYAGRTKLDFKLVPWTGSDVEFQAAAGPSGTTASTAQKPAQAPVRVVSRVTQTVYDSSPLEYCANVDGDYEETVDTDESAEHEPGAMDHNFDADVAQSRMPAKRRRATFEVVTQRPAKVRRGAETARKPKQRDTWRRLVPKPKKEDNPSCSLM